MATTKAAARKESLGTADDVEEPDVSALVTEDDTPVDNIFSEKEQRLLTESLYSAWSGPPHEEGSESRPFAALANVGLFASPEEPPVVPDVMLSLDVTLPADFQEKKNRSYFIWRFGKPPEVVIEIVSNREGDELGEKLRRYRRMRISYYVVYDPLRLLGEGALRVFELRGDLYLQTALAWFESVGLGLVEWEGTFEGTAGRWLRWCTRDQQVVPTGAERAAAAEARAETAKARAETAEARAETAEARAETAEARAARLAARLRELGIEPDDIP
jgi:Uma2 family endonuclease